MPTVRPDDEVYVFRFRKELEEFANRLGEMGFAVRIRFFREQPRAEIRTWFGFGRLIALIRVHGEMGVPHIAVITFPKSLPAFAKRFLRKKFPTLDVRFNVHA